MSDPRVIEAAKAMFDADPVPMSMFDADEVEALAQAAIISFLKHEPTEGKT